MREVDLAPDFEVRAVAVRERRCRPFADAVHGENGSFLERRREEGRGRVARVMFGEHQPLGPVDARLQRLQVPDQRVLLEQLLLDPQRHRAAERRETLRRKRGIGFQQPLELHERLLVEGDEVDILQADPADVETGGNRMLWHARIVLLPAETLFLHGGDDAAVLDQRRGAVVIERGETEDPQSDPRTGCR